MSATIVCAAIEPFSVEIDAGDDLLIHLVFDATRTSRLWTRRFSNAEDRDAVIQAFRTGALDLVFLARATMIFGPATIADAVNGVVDNAFVARMAREEQGAKHLRDYAIIELFARDTKHGYRLQLERRSEGQPAWSVRYDRGIERDRLCDWLRWQKARFAEFLDHAGEHGSEALTRLLTDEMFATERRVKTEGRGAGGMRPLRMWRGD